MDQMAPGEKDADNQNRQKSQKNRINQTKTVILAKGAKEASSGHQAVNQRDQFQAIDAVFEFFFVFGGEVSREQKGGRY